MFSNKKLLIAGIFAVVLLSPVLVYGAVDSIQSLSIAIANVFWVVFTVIALLMFIVAGVQFLTAMGDPEKIHTARMSAIWGVVGVAVGIIAYSIVGIVTNILK